MSEEKSSVVALIEAHEEFIQHVERGSRRIRGLSLLTIAVATILSVSYLYQLLLPYAGGVTTVTVQLNDPVLQATEASFVALALVWLYVGVADYRFTKRLGAAIGEARTLEKELEKRMAD